MNQIAVANLMMNLKMNNSKTVDESMVRHMILNSIRMYRKEHHSEYGEVVLTWDSKHSWRKDYFPQYKAGRRKGREKSSLDWDKIFTVLNNIRNILDYIFGCPLFEKRGQSNNKVTFIKTTLDNF